MKIAVVDYGMGNLRSVSKAIEHVAPQAQIDVTSDPARVAGADRVVFPGQGAMPDCMRELEARGLHGVVVDAARSRPFLGICIGLQMLFERSDEGGVAGLGLLAGTVRRFPDSAMVDSEGRKLLRQLESLILPLRGLRPCRRPHLSYRLDADHSGA